MMRIYQGGCPHKVATTSAQEGEAYLHINRPLLKLIIAHIRVLSKRVATQMTGNINRYNPVIYVATCLRNNLESEPLAVLKEV
jgi:hypothetical protein